MIRTRMLSKGMKINTKAGVPMLAVTLRYVCCAAYSGRTGIDVVVDNDDPFKANGY
jgi:hypothetical protein